MAFWHEVVRIRGRFARYSTNNKARQIVQRSETSPDVFEAYYERWIEEGELPAGWWQTFPDGWMELWPVEPITATTVEVAKEKALALLEIVASRTQDELFETRPIPTPIRRKQVHTVPSPTHKASANIYQHSLSHYEVRYFGDFIGDDVEEGWRLPVPAVEGMLVPKGFQMQTFAGSLESAEQIAASELERIVSDGKIKTK